MSAKEEFIEIYRANVHREGADALLDYLENKSDFFTSPASARYHGAYVGGLCEHSVNVYHCLREYLARERVQELYGVEAPDESVAVSALLHDLCKANTYVREHHAGPGEVYSYVKKDRFPMGHGEKSVYLIARFMKLEDEEALAIRWHMGAWDDAVRGGSRGLNEAMKLHRIVYELHAADMRATHIVEAGMA